MCVCSSFIVSQSNSLFSCEFTIKRRQFQFVADSIKAKYNASYWWVSLWWLDGCGFEYWQAFFSWIKSRSFFCCMHRWFSRFFFFVYEPRFCVCVWEVQSTKIFGHCWVLRPSQNQSTFRLHDFFSKRRPPITLEHLPARRGFLYM